MLEAVNIVHYLFSTSSPPLFLQEAKQVSRNIPPMYFTACTEKNRNAKPWCDISNPCHSTADHIFPSSFTSCTQPTRVACAGLPVASLATGIPVWKDISFKANAAPSSDTQGGFFFFLALEVLIWGTDSSCLTNISLCLGSPSSFLSSLHWKARVISDPARSFWGRKPSAWILQWEEHLCRHKNSLHPSCLPVPFWGCCRLDRLPAASQPNLVLAGGWTCCHGRSRSTRFAAGTAASGSTECRLLLHNGFLLFLSHRGSPRHNVPVRAGAAWQNPADRNAREQRGCGANIAFLCSKFHLFPACCGARHGKAEPTARGQPSVAKTGHQGMSKFWGRSSVLYRRRNFKWGEIAPLKKEAVSS